MIIHKEGENAQGDTHNQANYAYQIVISSPFRPIFLWVFITLLPLFSFSSFFSNFASSTSQSLLLYGRFSALSHPWINPTKKNLSNLSPTFQNQQRTTSNLSIFIAVDTHSNFGSSDKHWINTLMIQNLKWWIGICQPHNTTHLPHIYKPLSHFNLFNSQCSFIYLRLITLP